MNRLIEEHERGVAGKMRVRVRGKIQVSPLSVIKVKKFSGATQNAIHRAMGHPDNVPDHRWLLVNEGGSGRMALTLRWLIFELMVRLGT